MNIVLLLALGTLVYTLVNFVKYAVNGAWKSVLSQFVAWGVGIAAVFVMGATQFAAGFTIGGVSLDSMAGWSKVFVGLLAASLLSAGNDLKKAIDHTDSARVPSWPGRAFARRAEKPQAMASPALTVPQEWVEEVRHTVVTK